MTTIISCLLVFALFGGSLLALVSTDPEFHEILSDRSSSWGWEMLIGGILLWIALAFIATIVVMAVWHLPFPNRPSWL